MTTEPLQCVADGGLINPAAFPAKSADLDVSAITGSAGTMRSMGTAVEEKTTTVKTTWDRLTGCYRAPEQEAVYAVMTPAVTSAADLKTRFADAARFLDTYADALAGIKPRLADLERRAAAFRAEVIDGVWVDKSSSSDANFGDHVKWAFDWVPGVDEERVKVPWNEDGDTVNRNNDLLDEYAQLLEDVSTAAATCANGINGLLTGVCVAPVEAIPAEAFTSSEAPMPWGSPVVEDRNCRESVGHGAYTFGKDLVQGTGMLLFGYNPENGEWFTGDAYGQAWGGLGDLVGSIAVLASPVGWVAAGMAVTGNNDNPFSDWMYDRAVTVRDAGSALVGYDPYAEDGWHAWKEDGVAAGTTALLNVGTFFIPAAGQVSGGLKAGSIGARVARIAGAGAEFAVQGGSWVVRGGVRVITGLRLAVTRFNLDDLIPTMRPGQVAVAGTGLRLNPAGLLNAMTDASHAAPTVRPHTPVGDSLFGSGSGPRVPDVDVTPGRVPDAPDAPTVPRTPDESPHAPVWEGGEVNGRPDVSQVPNDHLGDPRYDPAHPHYDGTPRGEHGNVGTVDPDVPSQSGLTNSGRLLDPEVIPEPLRPYVEAGTIINDNGVLRLAEDVEITFRQNRNHDGAEFARQLGLQEQALRQMSLDDWTTRFDEYLQNQRTEARAQADYRAREIELAADGLVRDQGLSPTEARARAAQEFDDMAVLHGPDQKAGGNPQQFTGSGDSRVNSSLGSQWRAAARAPMLRARVLDALVYGDIPEHLWGDIRMNVSLAIR